MTGRLFWDDFLAILGLTCYTGLAILNETSRGPIYMMIAIGRGEPPGPPFTTPEKIVSGMVSQFYQQFFSMVLFCMALWSVKASLLMFYRRLFFGFDHYMRWWWVVVVLCVATYICSFM